MIGTIVGGWAGFRFTLTDDDTQVFDKALERLLGVKYTPLAVATQVVAGVNYCFLCQGNIVNPDQTEFAAKVYIFQPPNGEPFISHIERVEP